MALQDFLATAWRNYIWPLAYAAGTAAITVAEQQVQTGNGFSAGALEAAAILGAAVFIGSRLNPTSGKDQPFVEPHK